MTLNTRKREMFNGVRKKKGGVLKGGKIGKKKDEKKYDYPTHSSI